MTISATDRADSDRLEHSLELYRDLSVALRGRIAHLKAGAGDGTGKLSEDVLVKAQLRALAVLEAEASLVKRSRGDGAGERLDLESARAEILARLALWSAAG